MKIFELEALIPGKLRRKLYRFLPAIRGGLLALVCLVLFYGGYRFLPIAWKKISPWLKLPWQMVELVAKTKPDLKMTDKRINVLLLGIGGSNHQAADLTDSMIFVSVNTENGQTIFLSLPRDIWLESLKAKINTAFHYGEEKQKGGGLILAKAAVGEVVAQPIHYAVVLDFDGFIKAVDLLGGLTVDVERTFDDNKYPIPGKENTLPEAARYEHLHFESGKQIMNGETALKFTRSRYAEGEEGSDFSRSRRQQKILLALKNKLLSSQVLLNPGKISELTKIFSDNVKTNILPGEYVEFAKLAKISQQGEIKTLSLGVDEVDKTGKITKEGLLENPPLSSQYQNQWVLIPKDGDWTKVHQWIERLIKD